jgi:manganese transport protein
MLALLFASTALALTTRDHRRRRLQRVAVAVPVLPRPVGRQRQAIMGDLANGPLSNAVGCATIAFSTGVALLAFPLLILTKGGTA